MTMTKTEIRVLHAVRIADRLDIEQAVVDFPDQPAPVAVARGIDGIINDTNLLTGGRRKASYVEVSGALRKLVARGIFEKKVVHGLGGSFTTYTRRES